MCITSAWNCLKLNFIGILFIRFYSNVTFFYTTIYMLLYLHIVKAIVKDIVKAAVVKAHSCKLGTLNIFIHSAKHEAMQPSCQVLHWRLPSRGVGDHSNHVFVSLPSCGKGIFWYTFCGPGCVGRYLSQSTIAYQCRVAKRRGVHFLLQGKQTAWWWNLHKHVSTDAPCKNKYY